MYLSHQRLSCSNHKVKVNTNIAKHCIACTLNCLSDDGTCFPTPEMNPYRHLYKIILPKSATDDSGSDDGKEDTRDQEFSANFRFTEADVKVTSG